jgi:hypothetical protein
MKIKILIIAFITSMLLGYAQIIPFDYSVKLKPFTISNLSGLHSFVVAQSGGKWLIICCSAAA